MKYSEWFQKTLEEVLVDHMMHVCTDHEITDDHRSRIF
ncbi:MAG: hypothetical protein P857_754 [Candidatus Xenolissoclinum pacificiensis L6]|uniref:Uncharacterized protein n=1 Tax=Candidatus Xenolissoclinum pacificiensis L6 TaxID=1401685 RepID=W2UZJ0_9RICK|nr:MAG: hypothetical protein P857_754 [Candidatus Xenolissoclinum pacificiensis L6]